MWTPDYFVRYVSLPHALEATVLPNNDGSYDIYINSSLSNAEQKRVLEHELEHIRKSHFYTEIGVARAEAEANGHAITETPHIPLLFVNTHTPVLYKPSVMCPAPKEISADFAVYINGDGMAPYLKEGTVAYGIRDNNIATGDAIVFLYNDRLYCKQYVTDSRNCFLISANRTREDSDIVFWEYTNDIFTLGGKLLLDNPLPRP